VLAVLSPLSLLSRRPPSATPFPYTTLFRSQCAQLGGEAGDDRRRAGASAASEAGRHEDHVGALEGVQNLVRILECGVAAHFGIRSEEHTSALQSRENLVCRLLLEKKNRTRR